MELKPYIVRYKPKATRVDPITDKTAMFEETLRAADSSFEGSWFVRTRLPSPPALPRGRFGIDIQNLATPAIVTRLSNDERDALLASPDVDRVEEDVWVRATELAPDTGDPDLVKVLPLGVGRVGAPHAWLRSKGEGVRVAVVDTGIDSHHPNLKAGFRGGAIFVEGAGSADDDNGHGTHCAGTIAAAFAGRGVVGVAPSISLYSIKVLNRDGVGAFGAVAAGVEWAMNHGIHVVNLSLQAPSMPDTAREIFTRAWTRGLLLVSAAGNRGEQGADDEVQYPARHPSCIAVAALAENDAIWPGSCRGTGIDLCAPGKDVLSTLMGGGYGRKTGTSMACPHVAGVAALILSLTPGTNADVRRKLLASAKALGDADLGRGIVDAAGALSIP
jgi:subtilisin